MDLQSVVDRLVTAIERGDLDGLASLYASDAVQHHPLAPEPLQGRDAIREGERALLAAFSEVTLNKRQVLTGDSTVVAELVLAATNTGAIELSAGEELQPSGRRIVVPSVWVLELGEDGLIVEERDYFDTGALFSQLGLEE